MNYCSNMRKMEYEQTSQQVVQSQSLLVVPLNSVLYSFFHEANVSYTSVDSWSQLRWFCLFVVFSVMVWSQSIRSVMPQWFLLLERKLFKGQHQVCTKFKEKLCSKRHYSPFWVTYLNLMVPKMIMLRLTNCVCYIIFEGACICQRFKSIR